MLVLSRRNDERIHIGPHIILTVIDVRKGKVVLGIDAPDDLVILREELVEQVQQTQTLLPVPPHDKLLPVADHTPAT